MVLNELIIIKCAPDYLTDEHELMGVHTKAGNKIPYSEFLFINT